MINSIEVRQAFQGLARELVSARSNAPFKIVYKVTGLYMNLVATCLMHRPDLYDDPEGFVVPVDVSPHALHLSAYIREQCYVPDKGTWYSMKVTILTDNTADINLNFDDEPLYFGESLDKIQYALDLKKFPVSELNQKPWLLLKF